MWFSRSLAALGLLACAVADVQDQTTTDENGIRSIPVCSPLCYDTYHTNRTVVAHAFTSSSTFTFTFTFNRKSKLA